jgi:hypothetical protein
MEFALARSTEETQMPPLEVPSPTQTQAHEREVAQIAIPTETFVQLERAAQAEHLSVEELAKKIIREHLRALRRIEMNREMDAYRAQHAQILEKYRGEFIAMYQGEIVDHDSEMRALYLRIDERFPDETVLMKQVKPEVEEVLNFRSPQVTLL